MTDRPTAARTGDLPARRVDARSRARRRATSAIVPAIDELRARRRRPCARRQRRDRADADDRDRPSRPSATALAPRTCQHARAHPARAVAAGARAQLLRARDLDDEIVEAELDRLERVGLLDDAALAENLVRTHCTSARGSAARRSRRSCAARHIDHAAHRRRARASSTTTTNSSRAHRARGASAPASCARYDDETAKRRLTAFLHAQGLLGQRRARGRRRRRSPHAAAPRTSACGSARSTAELRRTLDSTHRRDVRLARHHRAARSQPLDAAGRAPRTYEVRTFGCQMNVHDSERLSGSLEAAGYVRADGGQADVVVINTCAVRENADNKLYGTLGHLASRQARARGHADRRRRLPRPEGQERHPREGALGRRRLRHPQHGLAADACSSAPATTARPSSRSSSRSRSSRRRCPTKRESTYSGWVSISVGCNNTCTFCIVPVAARQGEGPPPRRHPRRDPGCSSTTAPSRSPCSARTSTPTASSSATARRSASCCAPPARSTGSSASASPARTRPPSPTTSSTRWPRRPTVMPQLHMPLQSGSDRILKAMRRSLPLREVPRHPRPGARADPERRDHAPTSSSASPARPKRTSQETLRVVEQARFASRLHLPVLDPRGHPGRDACPTRCPRQVVQERYERLAALQDRISLRREPEARRPRGRGARRRRRGQEGRRHAPPLGPRRRQPARALRGARRAARSRGRATSSPSSSPTPRRSTSSRTPPTAARSGSAAPARATPGTAPRRSPARAPARAAAGSSTGRVSLGLPTLRVGNHAHL